jgi:hypothetical protein
MKRNAVRIVVAVLAALGLTAALASDGDGKEPGTVVSEHYDLSLSLPPGWHASGARLVTKLLMPREVVSVGTFGMAPGSGGNCGREPVRAIGRMGPGDALVSVQEYVVTKRMRPHLTRSFPPLDEGIAVGPEEAATIPFSTHGRAFDALVYFGSRPSVAERAEVAGILGGLDFGPHPVEFGSGA